MGDFTLNNLVGMDVHGKTVGVIGTGKIGQCFIDIMVGFGCRVLCYDAYPNDAVAKKRNTAYTDLATLLRESDILSLHVPLTEETRYLMNDATLAQTKPGVILINTSRGGLIDSKALVRALKSGRLGGCALDVYEDEGDYFYRNLQGQSIKDDLLARLTTFQNVLITSHQVRAADGRPGGSTTSLAHGQRGARLVRVGAGLPDPRSAAEHRCDDVGQHPRVRGARIATPPTCSPAGVRELTATWQARRACCGVGRPGSGCTS